MVSICLGVLKVFFVCMQVCGMYACVFTCADVHAHVYICMWKPWSRSGMLFDRMYCIHWGRTLSEPGTYHFVLAGWRTYSGIPYLCLPHARIIDRPPCPLSPVCSFWRYETLVLGFPWFTVRSLLAWTWQGSSRLPSHSEMTWAGGKVEELGWVESTLFAHAGPEGLRSIKSSVILDAMNQHPVKPKYTATHLVRMRSNPYSTSALCLQWRHSPIPEFSKSEETIRMSLYTV